MGFSVYNINTEYVYGNFKTYKEACNFVDVFCKATFFKSDMLGIWSFVNSQRLSHNFNPEFP